MFLDLNIVNCYKVLLFTYFYVNNPDICSSVLSTVHAHSLVRLVAF